MIYISETIKTYGLIIAIVVASFWFAYKFVPAPPPSEITIAAGSETGNYYKIALQYQEYLEDNGIKLKILSTAGSVENINLVLAEKADIGFVQSGLASKENNSDLQALGSLYYEPLWVFTHDELEFTNDLQSLKGHKIAIGIQGSGVNNLARDLLAANGITNEKMFLQIGGDEAVRALKSGEVKALFKVSTANSSDILSLLKTSSMKLMSFERANGYSRLMPYLTSVDLPQSSIDIAKNLPPEDIELLSPVAQLVTHNELNGAIKSLLVRASTNIHNTSDTFSQKGQFPTQHFVDFKLAEEAHNYYTYGPNFFQRILPFWFADMLNRMVVMIIPLLGIMIPLLRIASPTYRWRIRSKIYRWYKNLNKIEARKADGIDDTKEALDTLNQIDKDVRNTKIPLSYSDELYNLRLHIRMIKEQLKQES